MAPIGATHVQKVCAYITRGDGALLVFEGPDHDGLQVPTGTVEPDESSREALFRGVLEASGIGALASTRHVASDVRTPPDSPQRRHVRQFFHATVYEPRERWSHVVTGDGASCGDTYELSWVDPAQTHEFALGLGECLQALDGTGAASGSQPA